MIDIDKKIRNNEYKTTIPYPVSPTQPAILSKLVKDLTKEEYDSLEKIKNDYENSRKEYYNQRKTYFADEKRLEQEFISDLEEYYGLKGHPKAAILYSKA